MAAEGRGFFHHGDNKLNNNVDPKLADQIKKHGHKEHLAEAGALLGGAVALFEKHKAKKDSENAHKHHIGEAVAGAVAIGAGAYALHENHDKKQLKKEAKHNH